MLDAENPQRGCHGSIGHRAVFPLLVKNESGDIISGENLCDLLVEASREQGGTRSIVTLGPFRHGVRRYPLWVNISEYIIDQEGVWA
ncbi:hypothetical protein STHERM_c03840 [Spirochaeta thermophila DSM 6192]|uniref:Uncharacterized protein n=1 Tax=Winmispira thermophila (strain ATCC 49972 / DSM 6192 / RI 19.B1) TaxID=665571 RepID=E0RPP2_WINT6|nr:hypothetical protein STHERM_c03840 [Spirochaeta thermophila DSM 6192]